MEDIKKNIDDIFVKATEKARDFNEALMELRSIELPDLENVKPEDRNEVMKIGRDLDMRVAFLLRSLLVQHGNVLWL